ncbi:hypothetical protein Q8A67_001325 [Cirrhinus molitorella]|uniref:Uncharacterized protein n=1 Tax=Cirrhinus molitorella TaxID=172907 RepID=A0AA88Q9K9_9TELE|nr:hypothetical protein Q8A67_001325 [Cirrhinus molitorella]
MLEKLQALGQLLLDHQWSHQIQWPHFIPQQSQQGLQIRMKVWKEAIQLPLQCGDVKGKGQKMKQVEWEPCKLCGKKWPLEWVADQDTF